MIALRIPDMSCGHCTRAIDRAVKALDPAAVLEVDFAAHVVRVSSTADEAALRRAIEDAGYPNETIAA